MAINYKARKKRNGINKKELYYAVPINKGVMKTKDIAEQIQRNTSFSRSDVIGMLDALGQTVFYFNKEGFSVKLDGLGTFSISATSEGYETPEECLPERVEAKRVRFIADPELRKLLKTIKFERM